MNIRRMDNGRWSATGSVNTKSFAVFASDRHTVISRAMDAIRETIEAVAPKEEKTSVKS